MQTKILCLHCLTGSKAGQHSPVRRPHQDCHQLLRCASHCFARQRSGWAKPCHQERAEGHGDESARQQTCLWCCVEGPSGLQPRRALHGACPRSQGAQPLQRLRAEAQGLCLCFGGGVPPLPAKQGPHKHTCMRIAGSNLSGCHLCCLQSSDLASTLWRKRLQICTCLGVFFIPVDAALQRHALVRNWRHLLLLLLSWGRKLTPGISLWVEVYRPYQIFSTMRPAAVLKSLQSTE